jgi:hypothetical protein
MANCLTTFKVAGVRDDFPAFAHFGGMPKVLVIDNLRAAVTQADWFDPELNPKVQSFCRHYGAGLRQPGYPRPLVRVSPGRLASMGPGFVSPDIKKAVYVIVPKIELQWGRASSARISQ